VYAAFARRDIDAALELIHPQMRLWVVTAAVTRGGRPYVGHDGMREYWQDISLLWQELELVPSEFELVDGAVVVVGEVRAHGGAGSLRQPTVWTWRLSDGLVIDCRVDSDVQAARDALGEAKTVEGVLRAYHDAFNRRDAEGMIALATPGVVSYPAKMTAAQRKYVGHEGLRDRMRDELAAERGHMVVANEVRKLEQDSWALLGQLVIDDAEISPFAALARIDGGMVSEVREFLSEAGLLRDLGYLPDT
jgi:ketosteroid isomerase-like protein